METIQTVSDESLAILIEAASKKVVYVAPGVGMATVDALKKKMRGGTVSTTIIIDSDEDAYRIGYGDYKALSVLHDVAKELHFPLRKQPGLRVGMLVSDEDLVIWAPTARSVEPEQNIGHPNAIFLKGTAVSKIESAVGADHSDVLAKDSEIGKEALKAEELNNVVRDLENNPPAPFDLAQKARVFSTKFQFIETEVRGAEWTGRSIKLSNLILNADLPKELRDVLETNVHPFKMAADLKFDIPYITDGETMYRKDGSQVMKSVTQAEIQKNWAEIRDKYLTKLKGFGWLIKKDSLKDFRAEVKTYEESLKMWVTAFREHIESEEDTLVKSVVSSIEGRLERSGIDKGFDLEAEINAGLQRMRVIDPAVRIVPKNVSWESSRDDEFLRVLKEAYREEDIEGWFEEYTAAKEKA